MSDFENEFKAARSLVDNPRPFTSYDWTPAVFTEKNAVSPTSPGATTTTPNASTPTGGREDSFPDDISEKTVGDNLPNTIYGVPTSALGPQYFPERKAHDGMRTLLIVMVGLPARGKTFLAQKLCRLLGWYGYGSQVLNVQTLWRDKLSRLHRRHRRTLSNEIPSDNTAASTPTQANPPASSSSANPSDMFEHFLSDADSEERKLYRKALLEHQKCAQQFFASGGVVTILNDDFVTQSLRDDVEEVFSGLADATIFIEVMRDPAQNLSFDVLKAQDPSEYSAKECPNMSPTEKLNDFRTRVNVMQRVYETMMPECGKSYIKMLNRSVLEAHRVSGFLPSRIVSFLMNINQLKVSHPIFFSRHGQSMYNLEDRLGGDPKLTDKGHEDAVALCEFIASLKKELEAKQDMLKDGGYEVYPLFLSPTATSLGSAYRDEVSTDENGPSREESSGPGCCAAVTSPKPGVMPNRSDSSTMVADLNFVSQNDMQLWTSQLTRAIQTASPAEHLLDLEALRWSSLNEIHAGICEDLTYDEVKEKYPLIHKLRGENKYTFRYPQGESYQDLVTRLEPVITELENANRVVVVVAHQAVLRGLLAYFGSTSAQSSVNVEVPHRTVWRCSYNSKGIARMDSVKLGSASRGDGKQD